MRGLVQIVYSFSVCYYVFSSSFFTVYFVYDLHINNNNTSNNNNNYNLL